jgi:hypothetical protein
MPQVTVQFPPGDHVRAGLDRRVQFQPRIRENELRDDVLPHVPLVEDDSPVVKVLDDGVPLQTVLLGGVRVIDDLSTPSCLTPHAVVEGQVPRPVLDLDQVDHLGRADDQVDFPATALTLRRDTTTGEQSCALERVRGPDEFAQKQFAVTTARHGG